MGFAVFAMLLLFSCTKEESESVPSIDEIVLSRVDTTKFLQNRFVYIKGNGLDDVQEVLFNELQAIVNPTYVTSSAITVQIPSEFPEVISNKVSLVTKSGMRYDFDFTVSIREPIINDVGYTLSKNLITYTGANLAKPTEVSIDGIIITDFTVSNDLKTITFLAPQGISDGIVTAKIVCPAGTVEADFNFEEAAKPAILEIPCEWVEEGHLMQLNGRNLGLIGSVFMGDVEVTDGFVYNEDNSVLKFPVPAGVTSGMVSIKVVNQFGSESNSLLTKYKTSEFLFWDYDQTDYCWGAPKSKPQDNPNISIGGKYGVWEGDIAGSWWDQGNYYCGCLSIPMSITQNPDNYVFKFELNVVNPWQYGTIRIWAQNGGTNWSLDWAPYAEEQPYSTNGWTTVSIPIADLPYDQLLQIQNPRLMFFTGPLVDLGIVAEDVLIYVDNFRIDIAN